MFRIYYRDNVVQGHTQQDWIDAPDHGVQVIVEMRDSDYSPNRTYDPGDGPTRVLGRHLWDGDDEFDPFGWGVKYGELVSDKQFFQIWNAACADD